MSWQADIRVALILGVILGVLFVQAGREFFETRDAVERVVANVHGYAHRSAFEVHP